MSPPEPTEQEEEWDENEEEYDEDELDADAAAALAAEEMARRLGDQLWADINRAQAEAAELKQTALIPSVPIPVPAIAHPTVISPPAPKALTADRDIIATMNGILNQAAGDTLAYKILSTTVVPGADGASVWKLLNDTVASGKVSRDSAWALSQQIILLAKSDVLFSSLRHSNASVVQLNKGKRKREEAENENAPQKRSTLGLSAPQPQRSPIYQQLSYAVRLILETLPKETPVNHSVDAALVSSIQPQLYQVFLFAVTSSTPGGQEMNSLQELSGLIQVLGVLSGIQIAPQMAPGTTTSAFTTQPAGTLTDIGCAVYPCLIPSCNKTFSRLSHLRTHQRIHTLGRPFRCEQCPASFARNHDLKRHLKGHDTVGFKCLGCQKIFSRRDALKRHKNSSRKAAVMCVDANVLEVRVERPVEDEAKEERRSKLWSGAVPPPSDPPNMPSAEPSTGSDEPEEGEIHPTIMKETRAQVLRLYAPLKTYVTGSLGPSTGLNIPSHTTSATSQTLASVIARAQIQNLSASVADASQAASQATPAPQPQQSASSGSASLSSYGLSAEQALLLEQAIANAASAAQAQAEAEALLEDEEEYEEEDAEGEDDIEEEEV